MYNLTFLTHTSNFIDTDLRGLYKSDVRRTKSTSYVRSLKKVKKESVWNIFTPMQTFSDPTCSITCRYGLKTNPGIRVGFFCIVSIQQDNNMN